MNSYEQKQEEKRERYAELAEKARRESEQRHKQVNQICDMIPLGQPILVGHHSEKRHRADINRIDTGMRKAIDASEKAEYYENKAKSVGTGGISSDDPEALDKLREKLAKLEAKQEYMKRINKTHRAYLKTGKLPEDLTDKEREAITTYEPRYSWEPNPFPHYALSNNNGNMKNVRDRIKRLEAHAEDVTTEKEIGDIRVVDNVEDNRVQVFFPGKPDEATRKTLKSHGFRWSPSVGCWQAYRNNSARWALQELELA